MIFERRAGLVKGVNENVHTANVPCALLGVLLLPIPFGHMLISLYLILVSQMDNDKFVPIATVARFNQVSYCLIA